MAEGSSGFIYRLLRPLMILLRSVPVIVMVVIIMVMTKYDYVPLIATSLLLIPMISEAVCEGMRSIEPELLDVYRLNCGFNARVMLCVYLPLMAGYLKQAYAGAVGMGIKMVVTTEYLVQTRNSLGKAIYSSSYFNEYQDIYAYALIMILLVLLVSALPKAFQQAPLHRSPQTHKAPREL
jgi:NitT/TauT family transport system permease protein